MENFPAHLVSTASAPAKGVVFLAKGEFMIKCPYDPSHETLESRFYQHLEKCRRNYIQRCQAEGDQPVRMSCKWDYQHQILAPELLYHEHRCPSTSRNKQLLEFLLSDRQEINRILAGAKKVPQNGPTAATGPSSSKKSKLGEKEKKVGGATACDTTTPAENSIDSLKLCYTETGIDISQLAWDLIDMGSIEERDPRPLPIGKVAWSDPAEVRKKGIYPLKQEADAAAIRISQEDEPLFYKRRVHHRRRTKMAFELPKDLTKLEEEEDSDSEEYWQKKTNAKFDWLKHQFALKPENPVPLTFPPGLAKSERKQYVKMYAERLKTEFGVFSEDDLKAVVVPDSDLAVAGSSKAAIAVEELADELDEELQI